jgi:hypothetical protein
LTTAEAERGDLRR